MVVQLAPYPLVPDLLVRLALHGLGLDQALIFEMTEAAVSLRPLLGKLLAEHLLVGRGSHGSDLMSIEARHAESLVFKDAVHWLGLLRVVSALHHETVVDLGLTVETVVDRLTHYVPLLHREQVSSNRGWSMAELAHVVVVIVECDVVGSDV